MLQSIIARQCGIPPLAMTKSVNIVHYKTPSSSSTDIYTQYINTYVHIHIHSRINMDLDTPFILNAPSDGPILAPDNPSTTSSTPTLSPFEQAKTASAQSPGEEAKPALFTLQDDHLVLHTGTPTATEAGLVLGRHVVEDRSLNPKRVFFLPSEETLAKVQIEMKGEGRCGIRVAGILHCPLVC